MPRPQIVELTRAQLYGFHGIALDTQNDQGPYPFTSGPLPPDVAYVTVLAPYNPDTATPRQREEHENWEEDIDPEDSPAPMYYFAAYLDDECDPGYRVGVLPDWLLGLDDEQTVDQEIRWSGP